MCACACAVIVVSCVVCVGARIRRGGDVCATVCVSSDPMRRNGLELNWRPGKDIASRRP